MKSVTQAELIHANSRDIDSIFKIHLCNAKKNNAATDAARALELSTENLATTDSNAELNNSNGYHIPGNAETTKRINQLKSYIATESKFAQGAQAILKASTTENQKFTTMSQLENFKKNISEWETELNLLMSEIDNPSRNSVARASKVMIFTLILPVWKWPRSCHVRTRHGRLEKGAGRQPEKENG